MKEQNQGIENPMAILAGDKKRLLYILDLVETQHKLAKKHYELWKELLKNLNEEE